MSKGGVPEGYDFRFPFQFFQNFRFPPIVAIDFRFRISPKFFIILMLNFFNVKKQISKENKICKFSY